MPRRLNRKTYGWSYTYGRDSRIPSQEYLRNFDGIKWERSDLESFPTAKHGYFGRCKRIYFDPQGNKIPMPYDEWRKFRNEQRRHSPGRG